MRGEVGKETAKKEMDLDVLHDVTHDTFRISKKIAKINTIIKFQTIFLKLFF